MPLPLSVAFATSPPQGGRLGAHHASANPSPRGKGAGRSRPLAPLPVVAVALVAVDIGVSSIVSSRVAVDVGVLIPHERLSQLPIASSV